MTSKSIAIPAVVAGALGAVGVGAVAHAAEPTTSELVQQIQQLQSKVKQMESAQAAAPATKDVDATVASVLSDAEKRSKLLEVEGFTAGHTMDPDGHFVVQSADGNFRLIPMFQFQFRNVTSFRDSGKLSGSDDFENGFEVTRMKFGA